MPKITKTYRFQEKTLKYIEKLREIYNAETDTQTIEIVLQRAIEQYQVELAKKNDKRSCKTCQFSKECSQEKKKLEADHSPDNRFLCWVKRENKNRGNA